MGRTKWGASRMFNITWTEERVRIQNWRKDPLWEEQVWAAYGQYLSGIPAGKVGQLFKVSERTVHKWIDLARSEVPFQVLGQRAIAIRWRDEMVRNLTAMLEQVREDEDLTLPERATATARLLREGHGHLTAIEELHGFRSGKSAESDRVPRILFSICPGDHTPTIEVCLACGSCKPQTREVSQE